MKAKYLILFLILILGCADPVPEGKVTDKYYRPAGTTVTLVPTIDYDGNITLSTQTVSWPDTWTITIQGKNGDGEEDTRTLHVLPAEYSKIKTGDWCLVNGPNNRLFCE